MTFLHIANNGLPTHALGDRRTDHGTASKIRDALRARGRQAAARALAHQNIDMATALRVLAAPQRRREAATWAGADLPLRAGPFARCDPTSSVTPPPADCGGLSTRPVQCG